MKKIYALIPSERGKECNNHMMAWSGKVPCTGVYRCLLCGYIGDTTMVDINKEGKKDFKDAFELWKKRQDKLQGGASVDDAFQFGVTLTATRLISALSDIKTIPEDHDRFEAVIRFLTRI